MKEQSWAIGIDLGGTKIELAGVDSHGRVSDRERLPTNARDGRDSVMREVVEAVKKLRGRTGSPPAGVGVGVAGQIDREGVVRFAPNLGWRNVPLRLELEEALGLQVLVLNDVRAAAWGEWLHGAGRGVDDLVCIFVGTGIGGGIVSGGRMLAGCSNTAGEIGHITIDLDGPPCHCGNRGCLEVMAGGRALGERARHAIRVGSGEGKRRLERAGGSIDAVTARTVFRAAREGDPLARSLTEGLFRALVAGAISLVNAFNPCRLIFGGGMLQGMPGLLTAVEKGVRERALAPATSSLKVLRAALGEDSGVIGAAALVLLALAGEGTDRRG
jgi:glucokinase